MPAVVKGIILTTLLDHFTIHLTTFETGDGTAETAKGKNKDRWFKSWKVQKYFFESSRLFKKINRLSHLSRQTVTLKFWRVNRRDLWRPCDRLIPVSWAINWKTATHGCFYWKSSSEKMHEASLFYTKNSLITSTNVVPNYYRTVRI